QSDMFLYRRYLFPGRCADQTGRYQADQTEGLYQQSEAERLSKPSSDRQCPDLLCGVFEGSKGRGSDLYGRNGFLGEPGASDQVQEKCEECRQGDRTAEGMRG